MNTPLYPIVKLGYTGVYLFLLFLFQNIDCGYSLEPPRRGGSNENHNLCFEQKKKKNIKKFLMKFYIFNNPKNIAWACFRNVHTCVTVAYWTRTTGIRLQRVAIWASPHTMYSVWAGTKNRHKIWFSHCSWWRRC